LAFRDERDWGQFHNPKELAISWRFESAELLQLMQWHKGKDLEKVIEEKRGICRMNWRMCYSRFCLLADELKIDLGKAFLEKAGQDGENIRWRNRRECAGSTLNFESKRPELRFNTFPLQHR